MGIVPLLIALLVLGGCASLRIPGLTAPSGGYSQEDLRAELSDYASHFHLLVTQAADAIHASTTDPGVRKRTLLWKLQIIPLVEEAALEPNPQEAWVSLLALVVAMRQQLLEGPGRSTLGEQHGVAVEAGRQLEAELLQIGARFLGEAEVARVKAEVEQFARARPIAPQESVLQSIRSVLASVEATSAFGRVVAVPLAPFRALEGVGDSAAEIRKFNLTARAFVRAADRLPEQLRWQVELLLYDVEERETTAAALASLDVLTQSASRASEALAKLPEDARALLEDSEHTLARMEAVLASARDLAGPLRDTSERIQQASASWASVLGPRDGAERPPARPFDVREWESAVREVGATAAQLERLLQELHAVSEARVVQSALAPLDAALQRADATARAWIDHAAWRLAQLLVGVAALALAYRLLVARLGR